MTWFVGGRRIRKQRGSAGIVSGLCLLLLLGGCASSEGGKPCSSVCGDLCTALASCDVEVPSDCTSQCAKGVAGADCANSRPPDQLTCAELKAAYACADYCATLCTRAQSCGTFDPKLCAQGCTIQSPSICNSASVDARTCDQLKPELRDYEDTARAEQGGSQISIGFGGKNRYGLCADADDCAPPLACDLKTNTCSPCTNNESCARAVGSYICSDEKECLEVACTSDEDCFNRVCDSNSHTCVDCREDANCTSFFRVCNTETAKCVECTSDADCTSEVWPRCDVATNRCGECLSNADCVDEPYSPRCDTQAHYCTSCEKDADCAGTDKPVCEGSHCEACRIDADCKDPATPACYSNNCIECTKNEHCADGKVCSVLGHYCQEY